MIRFDRVVVTYTGQALGGVRVLHDVQLVHVCLGHKLVYVLHADHLLKEWVSPGLEGQQVVVLVALRL